MQIISKRNKKCLHLCLIKLNLNLKLKKTYIHKTFLPTSKDYIVLKMHGTVHGIEHIIEHKNSEKSIL